MADLWTMNDAVLERARHLAQTEARYADDLNPTGWRLLDFAFEYTLREAEELGCGERCLDILFPDLSEEEELRMLLAEEPTT